MPDNEASGLIARNFRLTITEGSKASVEKRSAEKVSIAKINGDVALRLMSYWNSMNSGFFLSSLRKQFWATSAHRMSKIYLT